MLKVVCEFTKARVLKYFINMTMRFNDSAFPSCRQWGSHIFQGVLQSVAFKTRISLDKIFHCNIQTR